MNILLTGATGFVGRALSQELLNRGFDLSVAVRRKTSIFSDKVKQFIVGDFSNEIDFSHSLDGIDVVIHLAGKAHVLDSKKASVLDEFQQINTNLTLNLATQAAISKVKRLIFISSIGVNGNSGHVAFTENDKPNPQEPYAISKYEAEVGLFELSKKTGLEVVIIRPPLVYGINAPGNFGRLINWASSKFLMPLPLGLVKNTRSLIALDNLVDFMITCMSHKKAPNEVFLISDGRDLSTTQLLRKIAKAFGREPYLLPIPVGFMVFMANLLGKKSDAIRLFSSLQVDSSKARDLLGWQPVVTTDEALKGIANEKRV
ncbi:UDP-glucose 4-epimerase [Isorropodon fossajaponicum endosymbiont JTNG4]|uniref:NAD-dependent epimerase/dehydratase family protein n=1 Tax=Isorropodon fossajaponicum symbiont TaxID=883811 RepID=UPI0019167236|nr:NAD-dependent epimerase/dehydratase family protein [Isorropodon fossajaponicum symbiont]BBB24030.1 UDP-glucose 4-epimerase [Isorropodon fossajaponicum endosymbiont JTNG4]